MFTQSKQRVFLPLMLIAVLFFGAAAAEAGDRRHDSDRTAKGAVIGAAVGALAQILGGRTEGGQVLKGAVVGGAVGALVGASQENRRDRYGRYDNDRSGYYNQDGYYVRVDDGSYRDGDYYRDGYPNDYRNDGYGRRDGRRSSHRHSSNCGHR
jgi:hypothetical protein